MNRKARRRAMRELSNEALVNIINEETQRRMNLYIDCFYEAMRANKIGAERAQKILDDTGVIISGKQINDRNK